MATELVLDQHIFQIIMLVAGGAFGLIQVFVAFILKGFARHQVETNKTMAEISKNLHGLSEEVLRHYVTKDELNSVEKYSHRGIHDNQADVQYHEIFLNLLAKHVNMTVPAKPPKTPR